MILKNWHIIMLSAVSKCDPKMIIKWLLDTSRNRWTLFFPFCQWLSPLHRNSFLESNFIALRLTTFCIVFASAFDECGRRSKRRGDFQDCSKKCTRLVFALIYLHQGSRKLLSCKKIPVIANPSRPSHAIHRLNTDIMHYTVFVWTHVLQ